MQAKTSIFLERTEKLAFELGITMRELGPRIGISPAMLFGCRSGQYQPSRKTWLKLEQAERAAGLSPPFEEQFHAAKTSGETTRLIESASQEEVFRILPPEAQALLAQGKLEAINGRLLDFFSNVDGLASTVEKWIERPRDKQAAKEVRNFLGKVQAQQWPARELWEAIYKSLRRRWENADDAGKKK